MKTVYIAKARIPSTEANSIHVMKISEAFSELCKEFELIIPFPIGGEQAIAKSYEIYGVSPFEIKTVNVKRTGIRNRYGFPLKCLWKARKADRIITRDPLVAFGAVLLRKHVVLDLHGDLKHLCGRAYRMIYWKKFRDSKYLHLVMITHGLAKYYMENYSINADKITVLPDGYTDNAFVQIEKSKILKSPKMNIGYCGGFIQGKGLGIIREISSKDSQNHYNVFGGTKEDAERVLNEKFAENVSFGGYVPNAKIPKVLNEQDVLLLPNQNQQVCKNEDIGKVTSPLKMFEYMASERVIVASDIPVLREVLNEENSYLVKADKVDEWLKVIDYISTHRQEAQRKAQIASEDVKQYSWKKRAETMLMLCHEK